MDLTASLIAVTETMHEGLVILDQGGRVALLNAKAKQIFRSLADFGDPRGQPFETLLRHCIEYGEFADASATADPDRFIRNWCEGACNKDGVSLHRLSDGRQIQVTQKNAPDGGHICVLSDVTEATLSEIRLRDAIESIPAAFAWWDATDRLFLYNGRFRDAWAGVSERLQIGVPYELLLRAAVNKGVFDINGPIESYIQARLDNHRRPLATHEDWLADGRCLQITERRTKDGGVAMVETDISSIKRHEMEMETHLAELTYIRSEGEKQSADLAQLLEEFSLQKEKAEAASLAKSQFLSNMSHELRTPLNAIIGFSDVFVHAMFGPLGSGRYQEYAQDIHKSGKHLLELIDGILSMSKIEAGRYDICLEITDLADLIENAMRSQTDQAMPLHITLENHAWPPLPLVVADGHATRRILVNLLSNAVKYNKPEGHVVVNAQPEDGFLAIIIKDTGVGMDAEKLHDAMEPFTQIERDRGELSEGAGLGLALARRLAELQGGTLRLESVKGVGTTAILRLPLAD